MWSERNYSGQHEFGQDVHGRGVGCAELSEMAEEHMGVNPPLPPKLPFLGVCLPWEDKKDIRSRSCTGKSALSMRLWDALDNVMKEVVQVLVCHRHLKI